MVLIKNRLDMLVRCWFRVPPSGLWASWASRASECHTQYAPAAPLAAGPPAPVALHCLASCVHVPTPKCAQERTALIRLAPAALSDTAQPTPAAGSGCMEQRGLAARLGIVKLGHKV